MKEPKACSQGAPVRARGTPVLFPSSSIRSLPACPMQRQIEQWYWAAMSLTRRLPWKLLLQVHFPGWSRSPHFFVFCLANAFSSSLSTRRPAVQAADWQAVHLCHPTSGTPAPQSSFSPQCPGHFLFFEVSHWFIAWMTDLVCSLLL